VNWACSSRPSWRRVAALVIGGALLVPALAFAQAGTATLRGAVVDEQEAPVPGALVTLTSEGTGAVRTANTNESGDYSFAAVPPGSYQIKVELQGFRTSLVGSVQLQVDTTSRVNVALKVGNLAESVQVTADAALVNTTDASLGNVIQGSQIRELPLEGRNVVGLLSLQPGAVYVPTTDPNTMDPRYGAVSGARADQANVTLDGIDVNDAENQSAYTSVLRVTLDSVQEFRVTTSNYGADQGRSSGAQVSMVTRSGSNDFSGAGYYSNRDTRFSANEYFLKLSQLESGDPSEPPLLNKNIFGFSLGGPVKRDKIFFFGNFEGLNEKREEVITRAVPSASFRDGVLVYQCANPAQCPGGTVNGLSGSHAVPAGSYGLTPAELARIDPLHIGPNRAALDYFRQFPLPNETGNYPGNIDSLRFAAPRENTFRTYIARTDIKPSGNHGFFARVAFQDDATAAVPQFPGGGARSTTLTNNWGIAAGYDAVLGSNKVNTFRYGYTVVDSATEGRLNGSTSRFRFMDTLEPLTSSNGRNLGTHNIVNDLSWLLGDHSLKIGTNLRIVRNDFFDNTNSFHDAVANGSWVAGVGTLYMPGGTCPPPGNCAGLPAVASGGRSGYADTFINILGVLSQSNAIYNYNIDGTVVPEGTPISRVYAANEYEFYFQDSWKVSDTLTVSGGLRYSLYSPPYEANGVQVAPSFSLGEWFEQRGRNAAQGIPASASPDVVFEPSGPKNGGRGFYEWDYNNFAPRASFAWTPNSKTVLRGGYSLVYDRAGAGIASSFDAGGSFGLSTQLSSQANRFNEDNPSIRFTSVNSLPPSLPAAPPAGFPTGPGTSEGGITIAIDDTLKTPYSHVFNLVLSRELGNGFAVEGAYVGRRGRNLLVRRDLAMPSNLVDTRSGVDYFTAATQLINAIDAAGGDTTRVAPIPYWENLFPDAAGGGLTATQALAAVYAGNAPDYITGLFFLDRLCDPACSVFGPGAYFTNQFDSLAALSSIGRSDYNALQLSLRKRFAAGYQFDFNYTAGVSKDHASEVERGGVFGNFGSGGYSGFLVNSWEPDRNYSYSDFDVRHQFNVNWLAELPFGRSKAIGSNAGPVLNAIIGDWAISGIGRWTSGFPFNVINCRSCWATNWNLQGNAELVDAGQLPPTGQNRNAVGNRPSPFQNPQAAIDFFRRANPGETGIRNLLRGDGFFGVDISLSKAFVMPFGHRLKFRWDVFNLTNTPRFDTGDIEVFPDRAASFGRYNSTLPICDGAAGRCMQASLRYEF